MLGLRVGGGHIMLGCPIRRPSMEVRARRKKDLEWLQVQVAKAREARRRDRCRIVLLALRGFTAVQIADKVGCSRRTAQQWVYRYRDEGLEGLRERPRPGQPKKLATASEAAFRRRLEAGPTGADGVCTLRGRDIQRILAKYSLQGVYDLLHRLGYSCLKPRPQHRKNDPAAMAAWLAEAPLLSTTSGKHRSTGKSRSGSRTRRVSDSKAR
jgi:transposase